MGEIDFSLDNLDLDKTLSFEEYKDKLVTLLKPILQKEFNNDYVKQQIRVFSDRINFACPYCGDSVKRSSKKRGNFILKGKHRGYYKCFNCGEFHKIDYFFSDFRTTLDLDVINYISSNLGDWSSSSEASYDMSILLDVDVINKYAIDREELKKCFGLIEVKDNTINKWLKNRLQFEDIKFLYSPLKNYLLILNLTPSGKVLGAQKRMFSGGDKYLTYKLSKLYEEMKKPLEISPEQLDYLNSLSMMFNICLVNFKRPVTLFEGPLDSFLYKNSIANTGANKELNIDVPVQYWYDSDETGTNKSIEKLNNNETVFLWSKLVTDLQMPYRKKWDLNDALIWIRKNNINVPKFNDYFSNDPLDIIDI
jgi:predicted RNA-binding Zn-ribbon protein involved in translation (DUF1610 family)